MWDGSSRAGSVGANLEESGGGQTKPDFIGKQFIALKEARESRFWLRVIAAAYPQAAAKLKPFIQESSELVAMLTASIKTAKSNPYRGSADSMDDTKGRWHESVATDFSIYHLPFTISR